MGGAGSKTEVKVLTPRQVGVVASPPLTTPRSGRRRGVGTRAEHKVARLERMMRKPEVRLAMSVTTVVGLQRLKRKAQANIAEKRRREKMSRGDRKVAQLERKKTASRLDDVVTPRRSN